MANVAILGYGTVGSGVFDVLTINKESIAKKQGFSIDVKYVLDIRDLKGFPAEKFATSDFGQILNDSSVTVVAETMGGLEPAYTYTKQAIQAGKHVVTSNKELVAKHGTELLALAAQHNVSYQFEASVGGGIPIIRPLNECLTGDVIEEITGILNGTTNYILTEMSEKGSEFQAVLKDAQEKGYAERNPEADVEGHDACRKIAILSSIISGGEVNYEEIYTEGITKITPVDFAYAKKMGKKIKLLALCKRAEKGFWARVSPCMIGQSHPLYMVDGVFNGIMVKGNAVDDAMFYGRGAGKMPTASAVVADVIAAAKGGAYLNYSWSNDKTPVIPIQNSPVKAFVRIQKAEGIEAKIAACFPEYEIIQLDSGSGELGFVTGMETEASLNHKLSSLPDILGMIRLEG